MKIILFGATGMVGEGVLHETLLDPVVRSVLVVGRRSCGVKDSRLTELIHHDFFDYSAIDDRLKGYDACFFCLGVTSVGKSEQEYRRLTYDLTMAAAKTLARLNPGMVFCYVSGAGTDSAGRSMWARVKGQTEQDLANLPFRQVYAFRPGYIRPTAGLKNSLLFARVLSSFYPVLRLVFPNYVCTLEDLGRSMVRAASDGYDKRVLECEDISTLAQSRPGR